MRDSSVSNGPILARPAAVTSSTTNAITPPNAPTQNISPAKPMGIGDANSPPGLIVFKSKDLTIIQARNGPTTMATIATPASAKASTPLTWNTLAPRLRR